MDLETLLKSGRGIATWEQFVAAFGRHRSDNLVRTHTVERVFPRVYSWPWDADLAEIRERAALASVGGLNALSHISTLAADDLPGLPPCAPIHVTAYAPRHPRGVPGELVVHRTRVPMRVVEKHDMPHVPLATALLTSWPLLPDIDRRAPMIEAARRKLIGADALLRATEESWWLPGIKDARELVGQIASGCESMLELFGYTHVFTTPGLDDGVRQRTLRIDGKTVRLDLAYESERLDIELDGWRFHHTPAQRERDLARDVLVATQGWQTLRFTHEQLFGDVDRVRADVLAVRAARRRHAA